MWCENVRSIAVEGDPATTIIEFAKTEGVDMIVIGSRGLLGVKRFVLGSVSHKVFDLADQICILIVK